MVSGRVAAEVGSSYVSEGKGERKMGKPLILVTRKGYVKCFKRTGVKHMGTKRTGRHTPSQPRVMRFQLQ